MTIVPDGNIEGIFNYCTRRCESCGFTARCALYQSEREYESAHPDATWQQHVQDSFAETFRLLEEWCKGEGIDFEALRRAAESDETDAEFKRVDAAVNADPLQKLAKTYVDATFTVMDAMAAARALRRWPADVEAALDTISWHAGMLGAKVYRALHGLAERGLYAAEDAVQNDWNGSAKLARILVMESISAWRVVMREGEAAPDSPLLELAQLLERIDAALDERFPDAMKFLRPGFDESATANVSPVEL
jgi:hypothetical protein